MPDIQPNAELARLVYCKTHSEADPVSGLLPLLSQGTRLSRGEDAVARVLRLIALCRIWDRQRLHDAEDAPVALMTALENSPVLCAYGLVRTASTQAVGASLSGGGDWQMKLPGIHQCWTRLMRVQAVLITAGSEAPCCRTRTFHCHEDSLMLCPPAMGLILMLIRL